MLLKRCRKVTDVYLCRRILRRRVIEAAVSSSVTIIDGIISPKSSICFKPSIRQNTDNDNMRVGIGKVYLYMMLYTIAIIKQ